MGSFEPKQFGKYYLVEKLAMGGMAEIYKAKTFGVDGFEKLLVIKRILPHCAADKDFITMLIDEAKLSVLLSHANIVQVFDLGKIGEDYFIAMEYIHGLNLRDIMYKCRESNTIIPPEIAVYILSEVCKGLDYAHRKTDLSGKALNIVHRDISPQNVLLSFEGEVKLVDFGIAKAAMNISHTMAGILKGKIAYMSPEQAMGKTINRSTDIFSVGILLYEMLTNTKLFTGESQFEVLKKIRTTRITENNLPASVPEKLRPILAKALAFRVEERFQHAGDFQIELTKYLYSSYVDFSPRKLASFIKELFADDIRKEEEGRAKEVAFESQTASMNIEEGAKQIDIVHRGIPPEVDDTKKIKLKHSKSKEEITHTPISIQGTKRIWAKGEKRKRWPFILIPILATVAAAAYFGIKEINFKNIPSLWEGKPAVETKSVTGSSSISSVPSGAKIILDGIDTGLVTPAEIVDLKLNTRHIIRLEKKDYEPKEETFLTTSAKPQRLNITLEEITRGIINVISDPTGASIILDGKTTGQVTPATIEKIELNLEHKITLSKPAYEDFEETFNLQSAKPQKISATLKPVQIETGIFLVKSSPDGAKIYLNGKDSGKTTPASIPNLKLNEGYTIKLTKEGYKDWEKNVNLTNAKPVDVIGALKPVVTKPTTTPPEIKKPVEVKKPEETKKPEEIKEPEDAKEPEAEAEGDKAATTGKPVRIKLASTPSNAQVFINTEHKGETPLTVSAPPGEISVLVSKEGYVRFSKKITAKPGQRIDLTDITLGDLYGEVNVTTNPGKASVTLDGQQMPAKTPVTIRKVRRDQEHTISISLSGYKIWTQTFSLDGERKNLNVNLEKE